MKNFTDFISYKLIILFEKIQVRASRWYFAQYPFIDNSVKLGKDVQLIGPKESFNIGKGTYINEAILSAGNNSTISIGKQCAIGYRVSIKAVTHELNNPHPDLKGKVSTIEKDVNIGNYCWIGDNVFIREGVTIGNNVTVGANSVVTKSFADNVIIAGAPAIIISMNK